jgi:hypothetical protein
MANKYFNTQVKDLKPASPPPKEPAGKAYPTPSFPQYPDTEQKGTGAV